MSEELVAEQEHHETNRLQDVARVALGTMLVVAGVSHLTVAREAFKAQVPKWVPMDADKVVVDSGLLEIALGAALVALPRQKKFLGRAAGLFFTTIFPGNIEQFARRRDGFGLNSDQKRFARLFMQPALVAWALWATGGKD